MIGAGPDLAETLGRDGFAVVPDVIGPAAIDELVAALGRVEDEGATLRRGGSVYGMRDLIGRVPEVRRLAALPEVRALVEPVLGPGAFAVRGTLFDKTPRANWNLPWHRDVTIAVRERREVPGFGPWTVKAGLPHVRPPAGVLARMLAVRLHLDDTGPRNGPLNVLPGSHLVADDELPAWRQRARAVSCTVRRGGVVLMRPLILHASSAADEPGHRRVIHLDFAADPLPGGLEWL